MTKLSRISGVTKRLGIAWFVTGLLGGCSQASFTGQGARASKDKPQPQPSPRWEITCNASPALIAPGDEVSLAVNATTADPAAFAARSLDQSVEGVNSSGEKIAIDSARHKLVFDTASSSFTRTDELPNVITPPSAGTYTVTLSDPNPDSANGGNALSTCTFVVQGTESCEETEHIGVNIAFLIDNSNSNGNVPTDCPDRQRVGQAGGSRTYNCGSQTNRERAVMTAFDELQTIAASGPDREITQSRMAVAYFPTAADPFAGYGFAPGNWYPVTASQRQTVATALQFARRPRGMTPFGAGFKAALEVFTEDQVHPEKADVVVLVTDGEPTDRDPSSVSARAEQLRARGIEVFTVFVTGPESRDARRRGHERMMRDFDERSRRTSDRRPWFDSRYATFDTYFNDLLGREDLGTPSLVQRVSSLYDPSCQDRPGSLCARRLIEVTDADALKDAFRQIVKSRAIRCVR